MKKRIPIGISDYKQLIENDCYYVDKTLLIKEVFEESGHATLITRPRRFGKTINLSMLKYFFEKTSESNAHLFEKKAIWLNEKYRDIQGKYPVIFITFKDAKGDNFEEVYESIVITIINEIKRHKPQLHSAVDEYDAKEIDALLSKKASKVEYTASLAFLSQLLEKAYKKKCIILFDEYDTPIHSAYHNGFYDKIVNFVRNIMSRCFKDNTSLELGVITGIMRTAKEGIFSGLNNLKVCDMFANQFADKFGFTEQEITLLLKNQELSQHQQIMKSWYNGYTFGNRSDIYNPWSILECLDNQGALSTYWSNTSENKLIKQLLENTSIEIKESLELLLQKKESELKEVVQGVIFPEVTNSAEEAVWSFLIFSGYLTVGNRRELVRGQWHATLRIPNQEVFHLYQKLLETSITQLLPSKLSYLLEAIITGNAATVKEILSKFVMNSMSFHDIPENEAERSYHLFILGLLVGLDGRYNVQSNRESGVGKYDVMLIPSDPKKDAGIIIELKKRNAAKETLEEAAQSAIDQINNKKYATQLQSAGCTIIYQYGIAFEGKDMLIILEDPVA